MLKIELIFMSSSRHIDFFMCFKLQGRGMCNPHPIKCVETEKGGTEVA